MIAFRFAVQINVTFLTVRAFFHAFIASPFTIYSVESSESPVPLFPFLWIQEQNHSVEMRLMKLLSQTPASGASKL